MAKKTLFGVVAVAMMSACVIACGDAGNGGGATFGPGYGPTNSGGGSENGGNTNSGNGGNGGGSLGGSGGSSGGGTTNNNTGVDPNAACATSTLGATAAPLHLVILFDRSGSMCEYAGDGGPRDCTNTNSKWKQATNAVKTFVSSPDSRGIKASLIMFPFADNSSQMCQSSKYSTALVNDISLPDSTQIGAALDAHVSNGGQTPTKDALTGTIEFAQTVQAANPKDKVAIVIATDGYPQGCTDDSNITPSCNAAKGVASTIPTYVIGVGDLASQLDQLAAAGGTTKSFTASTSTPSMVGSQLTAAFNTIRGASMSCNFNIPAAPMGMTLDYTKVNVQVTLKGTPGTIKQSQDCSDPAGWKYDNATNPTLIELCSMECDSVKADAYSSVNLILGCATQVSTVN
jgi:hypothetical protein